MTPLGHAIRPRFLLELRGGSTTFLNHGSYGATPRSVLLAQLEWRRQMERQPVRFMSRELPSALRDAACELASFLGARGDDFVFVDNATTAINTVLASIDFAPGDEIVLPRYAYTAVRNAVTRTAKRRGARVVEAQTPFPTKEDDEQVDAFARAIGPRTRLVVADHVSSPLAIVFPIARIVELCRARGVPVLVDGAHAPGMLPLDLGTIGATYYTGNFHKWLWAPKGCAFLWVAPDAQPGLLPLVLSNYHGRGFLAEFDWTGTRDPSAWLSAPAGLAFHRELGPERVRAHQNHLAATAGALLAERWGSPPTASPWQLGAMATVFAPDEARGDQAFADRVHDRLWDDHRIEVPVLSIDGRIAVRISGAVYNEASDYEPLAEALPAAIRTVAMRV